MRLAARAEMLFVDLPFTERVRRIAAEGFEVEMWTWHTKDLSLEAADRLGCPRLNVHGTGLDDRGPAGRPGRRVSRSSPALVTFEPATSTVGGACCPAGRRALRGQRQVMSESE